MSQRVSVGVHEKRRVFLLPYSALDPRVRRKNQK
jgi:hypothetical protein